MKRCALLVFCCAWIWLSHQELIAQSIDLSFLDFEEVRSLSIDTAGHYLIVGTQELMTEEHIALAKLDTAGNLFWIKNYVFGGGMNSATSRGYEVLTTQDGNTLIAGLGQMDLNGYNYQNGYLAKVAPDGELIWRGSFPCPQDFSFSKMIEGPDSNLYILTQEQPFNHPVASPVTTHLLKLSPEGQLLSSSEFYDFIGNSLAVMPNGEVILAGSVRLPDSRGSIGRIFQIGAWDYQTFLHFSYASSYFTDVLPTADGGLIGIGKNGGHLLVVSLGPGGEERWSKDYGVDGRSEIAIALAAQTNGHWIIAATAHGPSFGAADVLLMEIDERGLPLFERRYPSAVGSQTLDVVLNDQDQWTLLGFKGTYVTSQNGSFLLRPQASDSSNVDFERSNLSLEITSTYDCYPTEGGIPLEVRLVNTGDLPIEKEGQFELFFGYVLSPQLIKKNIGDRLLVQLAPGDTLSHTLFMPLPDDLLEPFYPSRSDLIFNLEINEHRSDDNIAPILTPFEEDCLITGMAHEDFKQNTFHLFPNPVDHQLYLNYELAIPSWVELRILNALGKELLRQRIPEESALGPQQWKGIIYTFPAGTYYLQIQSKQHRELLQFLKLP